MTELQKALKTGQMTVADIQSKLGITVKTHPFFPNLHMFKYNMIDSPMGNKIVQECRGVILDSTDNWEVIARPFDKFFNYGEGHAADIDWSTARVQEKLDGSLMILYYYLGQWHIASSGTPDAGGKAQDLDMSFADLFWKTWKDLKYEVPEGYENYTFMFELMTPWNRVVVPHHESKLTLIGVRHNKTGDELPVEDFYGLDYSIVKQFPLQTMEDVMNSFTTFDGIRQEGYVVVDDKFNRVKVKHPGYVAIHHLKGDDGPSHKKMCKIVLSGESSEVLTYFPEWKPVYDEVLEKYANLLSVLELDYKEVCKKTAFSIPVGVQVSQAFVQKEFASHAVKTKCPDALFKMKAGKIKSFQEYLSNIQLDHAMKILGYKSWTV